jgi:N-terminal domain of anti-restriction factor ArdC
MKTATQIDWAATLAEALNAPGALGSTYTRFYNYSFLNQIRLMMQGTCEPAATYNRWQELGRQVRKGSKAKVVLAPIRGSVHIQTVFKRVLNADNTELQLRGLRAELKLNRVDETYSRFAAAQKACLTVSR